jgi:cyanophycin synthetase
LRGVDTMAELARVKAVVPQSVLRDGASVLNADNEWTVDMADTARGEIIFFTLDEENPVVRDHLRERGRAVVLRETRQGEMITIVEHRRETSLLLASQIPATFQGRARVNIANAMAAASAALADDVQLDYIRQALRTFTSSFFQTPGRFNLLDLGGKRVVVDYCHNVAGLEAIADFVRRMGAEHAVAVISMPGDRSDHDMQAFGDLAGRTFDRIVIREDDNRRGRMNGEIAGILQGAVVNAGRSPDEVRIVLDELEAVQAAIDQAGKTDLIVLMVDKPAQVWDLLTRSGATAM